MFFLVLMENVISRPSSIISTQLLYNKECYYLQVGETLLLGELVGPPLSKTNEESHIAVIVFSKNYGDSSWCLEELAHIMKCKGKRGQLVTLIFYDVSSYDVQKEKQNSEKHLPDTS